MTVGPRVDGDFVPDEPGRLARDHRHKKVDIIIGYTADEGAIFTKSIMAQEELVTAIETNFSAIAPITLQCDTDNADPPSVARKIYNHYLGEGKLDPAAQKEQFTKMFSDRFEKVGSEFVALYHAGDPASKNTYSYMLTHRGQLSHGDFAVEDGRHWVYHADDLFYLFRGGPFLQPREQPPERPQDLQRQEDLKLRDIITTLWVNFASAGNPTPDDSLGFIWEPSTKDNLQYLDLKPKPTMEPNQRQEVRRFHASLPTKANFALHPHLVQEEPAPTPDAGEPHRTWTSTAQHEL